MSSETIIQAEGLSKLYRLGAAESRPETLLEAARSVAAAPWRNFRRLRGLDTWRAAASGAAEGESEPADLLWALRDVSFAVRRGEVVGVVGRNGAGKSTLLKILSRVTEPTRGRVRIRGRISSLLEVGTGFHPEMTGRENVYLNGTILGMTKREIDRKFEEIAGFSGVERFLDTPVKRYSSGQRVRLAFAVAAHLEPEVLIVDEVLAVGDQEFQRKCMGKMRDVASGGSGRTVLFVSHNMAAVEQLCDRVIVLRNGRVVADTGVEEGIRTYLEAFHARKSGEEPCESSRAPGMTPVIRRIDLLDADGQPLHALPAGDGLTVRIHYEHHEPLVDAHFGVTFESEMGVRVLWLQTRLQAGKLPDLPPRGVMTCRVASLPLVPGVYNLTVGCGALRQQLDVLERCVELEVVPSNFYGTGLMPLPNQSLVLAPATWEGDGVPAVSSRSS